jgi:hypothetical protein
MPTRYRAALAGKDAQEARDCGGKGWPWLVSVCASIDRLAFRRLSRPFASEPALLHPTTARAGEPDIAAIVIHHVSARSEPPPPPHACSPASKGRLSGTLSTLSAQTLLRLRTD